MRHLLATLALALALGCTADPPQRDTDTSLQSLRVVRIATTDVCAVVITSKSDVAMSVIPCRVVEGVRVMVVTP